MKKNFMMRAASVLLVAVMLTTCAISGTFAKYITADDASDSARVAKFGVVVAASGSLFSKNYLNANDNTPAADGADAATITVKSSDDDKLVAPGTKNENGITFAVTGTPEVDVKIDFVVENVKDVYLAAGDYADMTTGDTADYFNNASVYNPVKFTLTQENENGTTILVNEGTLASVETALENLTTANYNAGTDLAKVVGTLNLTWEWDFDDNGAGTYDKQDTLLGNLANDSSIHAKWVGTRFYPLDATTNFSTDTSVSIEITVTQID